MVSRRLLLLGGTAGLAGVALARWGLAPPRAHAEEVYPVMHSDADWRRLLNSDQYGVLRQEGTEMPFTSPLLHETRAGKFACAGCNQDQFLSSTKYDSHTGWPSFWDKIDGAVATTRDTSYGMIRDAVHCTRCGSHIGHVFNDGPRPTGLRYCMNGVALNFHPTST